LRAHCGRRRLREAGRGVVLWEWRGHSKRKNRPRARQICAGQHGLGDPVFFSLFCPLLPHTPDASCAYIQCKRTSKHTYNSHTSLSLESEFFWSVFCFSRGLKIAHPAPLYL
jgi:hypothetical protein